MTHKSIAVIGHVDHGKTALVEALTGTNTDTLAEERARGLTINLGFAHYQTPIGTIHLIDAPGHADFIRTTVSGLSGVDAVLLVISAREGIQMQTREHLKLARFLGIHDLTIALTKCDLVDTSDLAQRREEIENFAKQAGFESASVVTCSARSEDGIRDLEAALTSALSQPANRARLPGFFLPIDRVFSAAGVGTIITGTLIGAEIEIGSEVIIGDKRYAVRGVQVAGHPVSSAAPGTRVALNLRGLQRGEVRKGDVACAPNAFAPSPRLDVLLRSGHGERVALKHMDQVMMLIGTGHVSARVRLLASEEDGGDTRFAQIEALRPLVTYRGQAFVLRNPSSSQTICGGEILDPVAHGIRGRKPLHIAVLHAARTGDSALVAHALADRDRGEVNVQDVVRLSGSLASDMSKPMGAEFRMTSQARAIREADIRRARGDLLERLSTLHHARPIRPFHSSEAIKTMMQHVPETIFDSALGDLIRSGEIIERASGLAHCDHDPLAGMNAQQRQDYAALAARLKEVGLQPGVLSDAEPTSAEQADLIELLICQGVIVRLYNHALRQHILLHTDTVNAARDALRARFPPGTPFTTGEARGALGTNRKTIVPLLEHFDQESITRREGDIRILTS